MHLFFKIVIEIFPLPRNRECIHYRIFSIANNFIGIRSDIWVFQVKNRWSSGRFYDHFNLCILFIGLVGPRARLNFDAFAHIFRPKGFPLGLWPMLVDFILTRPYLILIGKILKFILNSNRILIFRLI